MTDDLGILNDYWHSIFMGSIFLYNLLILYLHHVDGYDLE